MQCGGHCESDKQAYQITVTPRLSGVATALHNIISVDAPNRSRSAVFFVSSGRPTRIIDSYPLIHFVSSCFHPCRPQLRYPSGSPRTDCHACRTTALLGQYGGEFPRNVAGKSCPAIGELCRTVENRCAPRRDGFSDHARSMCE